MQILDDDRRRGLAAAIRFGLWRLGLGRRRRGACGERAASAYMATST
jgi:hypothetical protein